MLTAADLPGESLRICGIMSSQMDAMDAVASGGFFPPDENAAADGEVVWSCRRDPAVKLARSIVLTTVAKEAAHRGEHEANRKTIARGKPGLFG
jgi:hypothetical protein